MPHPHENTPDVFIRAGSVLANSRGVAEFFKKAHFNVLQDIDRLIEQGVLSFQDTPYTHPQNGEVYRSYDMTRDGFTLLAMSFTGPKALKFKLDYIARFNELEEGLRSVAHSFIPDAREMEFVRLARQIKGERFASALWNSLGFYSPPGFEFDAQQSLFQPANQNIAISITHAA